MLTIMLAAHTLSPIEALTHSRQQGKASTAEQRKERGSLCHTADLNLKHSCTKKDTEIPTACPKKISAREREKRQRDSILPRSAGIVQKRATAWQEIDFRESRHIHGLISSSKQE